MSTGLISLGKVMPPATAVGFAVIWFGVLLTAVVLATGIWRRLSDRTYLYYAAYVGATGLMSLNNHVLADWWAAHAEETHFVDLNNFLHLPYAVFYLLFVRQYFKVWDWAPAWGLFYRWLLLGYGLTTLWWLVDCLRAAPQGSEWAILVCNLGNLLASLVLAGWAAHEHRPGAREFLYASLPLTLSGLVLVAQFLGEAGPGRGMALMAFRTGFILHLMVYLVALSVRHRALLNRERWQP